MYPPGEYILYTSDMASHSTRKGGIIDTVFQGTRNQVGSVTISPSRCGRRAGL